MCKEWLQTCQRCQMTYFKADDKNMFFPAHDFFCRSTDVLSNSECSSWLPRVTWKFSLAAVSAKSSIKSHWWSKKEGFSREQMSIWRQIPSPAVVSFNGCLVWVAPLVWSCHGLPLWFFGGSLSLNIPCWRWKTVETREIFLWHDNLVVRTTSVDGQIWCLVWVVVRY